jgi:hypothetical protein
MATTHDIAPAKLIRLLAQHELFFGVTITVRGNQIILERSYPEYTVNESRVDKLVKLTSLGNNTYGLSVMRYTGRWQKTPFIGTFEDLVHVMLTTMPHIFQELP